MSKNAKRKVYRRTELEVRRQFKTIIAEGYPRDSKAIVTRDKTMNTKFPVFRLEIEWVKEQCGAPIHGRRFMGYMIPEKELYIAHDWDIYAPAHKMTVQNRDGSSYELDESDWQTHEEVLEEQMDIICELEKMDVEKGIMKEEDCLIYNKPRMSIEEYEAHCAREKEKRIAEYGEIEPKQMTEEELQKFLDSFVPIDEDGNPIRNFKVVTCDGEDD